MSSDPVRDDTPQIWGPAGIASRGLNVECDELQFTQRVGGERERERERASEWEREKQKERRERERIRLSQQRLMSCLIFNPLAWGSKDLNVKLVY